MQQLYTAQDNDCLQPELPLHVGCLSDWPVFAFHVRQCLACCSLHGQAAQCSGSTVLRLRLVLCTVAGWQRLVTLHAPNDNAALVMQVPIYVRALDLRHAAELKAAGADFVTAATTEAGIALGSRMLQELGGRDNDIQGLTRALRKQLDDRSHDMMRVLTRELPSPTDKGSEEDEVFVFDQAAVSKSDMPSTTSLTTPGATTGPRGQENAAALGLQEAPIDRPVVVAKASGDDGNNGSGLQRTE